MAPQQDNTLRDLFRVVAEVLTPAGIDSLLVANKVRALRT